MPSLTPRRMARVALSGVVLGLAALAAGLLGFGDAAVALAALGFALLACALAGVVLGQIPPSGQHRRQPGFTGEAAWVTALAKEHDRHRARETADDEPTSRRESLDEIEQGD